MEGGFCRFNVYCDLAAIEIFLYEFENFVLVVVEFGAQRAVVKSAEAFDNAVNHCRAKHVVLLIYFALSLQASRRTPRNCREGLSVSTICPRFRRYGY